MRKRKKKLGLTLQDLADAESKLTGCPITRQAIFMKEKFALRKLSKDAELQQIFKDLTED